MSSLPDVLLGSRAEQTLILAAYTVTPIYCRIHYNIEGKSIALDHLSGLPAAFAEAGIEAGIEMEGVP